MPLLHDALRTNDARLVAAALGPYAEHLDADDLAAGRRQVRVHGRTAGRRRPAGRSRRRVSWRHARRPGRGTRRGRPHACRTTPPHCSTACREGRGTDAHLRPAHPHDLADHRRLRRDGRPRRPGRGGTGVLARAAAHQPGLVRRLLRLADRLGAVPGGAVRHPAPRHHRAEPQGGQRSALPRRARPDAALPGQGRRGRGRRDRLRLDDPGRGRGVRRPAGPGGRVRAARPRAHPAPRQGHRHPAHPGRGQGVRHRAPGGSWSTTSTRSPSALVQRLRLLDGLLDLPGDQDVAAADGARSSSEHGPRAGAGELGRRLGQVRSAAHRGDRERDAGRRLHAPTTWTW